MPDLYGHLTPQGVLNGSLQTIVYADNYNDLINKPSINSVELQGNKTAADLGLLTAGDIPVDSVNGKQGVVILDGDDIEYEAGTSVNSKITDLEAEIGSGPVVSVNGQQGVVDLDGTDIKYSLSKTLNQKIDEVEASIPVVSYPVTSVNEKTGAVVLDDTDIEHSSGVSVNSIINTITQYTPVYGNTASGAIATFDTSLALPLQDCTIDINGTGATGANITNHGKNYLDTSTNVNGKALSATGVETSVPAACYTDLIKVVGGEKYTFGATSAIVDAWNRRIHGYDESGNWVLEIMNSNAQSYAVGTPFTMTFTVPNGISYVRISYYKDTNAQLEQGLVATTYEAYNGTNYNIDWQTEVGTVSEGSFDVTTGKLTVVNGSMGAGEYQITPIPINQLSGTNNIFCDTGNTSVVYACSLKDYIDSQ